MCKLIARPTSSHTAHTHDVPHPCALLLLSEGVGAWQIFDCKLHKAAQQQQQEQQQEQRRPCNYFSANYLLRRNQTMHRFHSTCQTMERVQRGGGGEMCREGSRRRSFIEIDMRYFSCICSLLFLLCSSPFAYTKKLLRKTMGN